MKKHSSKKKALLIALAVIVVLILGAVGAVYGVTHGFYRSSNYTSDEDAMKDFTNVGEDTTAEDEVNPEDATGEVYRTKNNRNWMQNWPSLPIQNRLQMTEMYITFCW